MRGPGRKGYTLEEARRRMERYCAFQERCHQEVVQKLREMRLIPEAIDAIVVGLIEGGYLSEERFALAFARGRFRQKQWGPVRIQRELEQRGISDYLVQKALREIDEGEYREAFHALAQKRWDQLRGEPHPQRKKQKFAAYLLYRGWESERIFGKLREFGEDPPG